MTLPVALAGSAAAVLAGVHVLGGHVRGLHGVPRNVFLSAGSGVSLAYVFVHLLPELAAVEEHVGDSAGASPFAYLERHGWLMALLGVIVFYGLQLAARRTTGGSGSTASGEIVGWIHIGSYTAYNAIVGYLLVTRARESTTTLVLFGLAMAVHFLVNDHGLRADHGSLYHRWGRWLIGGAAIAGWGLGVLVDISEAGVGLLIAFLGGGIVMNVFKEELPEDRRSRWLPLTVGAVLYSALLLTI